MLLNYLSLHVQPTKDQITPVKFQKAGYNQQGVSYTVHAHEDVCISYFSHFSS